MRLYAVTDRSWLGNRTLPEVVEEAIKGGVTLVQLREKHTGFAEFTALARQVQEVCRKYNVPLIINDAIDVCLAVDADGVHIGMQDMALTEVRKRLGPDKIIGVTAKTVAQAVQAEQDGADYLGSGAVFGSSTKLDTSFLPYETLRDITAAVSIPVVAIGGITKDNIQQLKGSGIAGAAIVSGIFAQPDIRQSAEELTQLLGGIV